MLKQTTLERIILFLIITIVGSPYFSSWLPKVFDMPIGPLFRFSAIVLFYAVLAYALILSGRIRVSIVIFALLILLAVGAILSAIENKSNVLQIILGLHALVFYPMVFSILVCYFNNSYGKVNWTKTNLLLKRTLTIIFLLTSVIAIIDVITDGNFTLMLGYDPNYGGDNFSLINRYYSLVRANGGFADALAFGYLMAIGFIFFVYNINKKYGKLYLNIIGVVLTSIACVLSITRGAIITLVIAAMIFIYRSNTVVKVNTILMGFLLLLAVSLSSYSNIFMGRFTDSDKGSRVSTTLRYDMALESIHFLGNHPFGEGLGSQGAGSTLSTKTERINTDNFIFHSMLEAGIFGGVIFQLLILYQFKNFYTNTRNNRRYFFALFFLYWLSAAVSSSLQAGVLSVIFWIVCFIIYSETVIKNREPYLEYAGRDKLC
ncbi:O-antigen ligase family protein [Mangrovibacter phragmitis]|uniref:O-antigen ligase family protein n=1 Tax=Mangrovibacter phragmitis TaxID=1691903 RepID=UPI00336AA30E